MGQARSVPSAPTIRRRRGSSAPGAGSVTLLVVTSAAPPPAPPPQHSRDYAYTSGPAGRARPRAVGAAAGSAVVAAAVALVAGCASPLISDHPLATWVAVAAVLAAAALILGSRRLLAERAPGLLLVGALTALLVLCGAAALDEELRADGVGGVLIWLGLAGAPALSTGLLALSPQSTGWRKAQ